MIFTDILAKKMLFYTDQNILFGKPIIFLPGYLRNYLEIKQKCLGITVVYLEFQNKKKILLGQFLILNMILLIVSQLKFQMDFITSMAILRTLSLILSPGKN